MKLNTLHNNGRVIIVPHEMPCGASGETVKGSTNKSQKNVNILSSA